MKKLSIVIISDTHNKYKHLNNLPDADMIIHCGDMTSVGKEHEIHNFFKWYSKLEQFKYKICIAGNHDWLFQRNRLLALSHKPDNIIYLEDDGVEIEGIKFYGSPVQKHFNNWAFNRDPHVLKKHWEAIPDDVDVLITHTAPHNILDYVIWNNSHEGEPTLYDEVINRIKPPLHIFGHLHGGRGIVKINNTTFINACNLDEDYNCIHNPILIELIDNEVHILSQ